MYTYRMVKGKGIIFTRTYSSSAFTVERGRVTIFFVTSIYAHVTKTTTFLQFMYLCAGYFGRREAAFHSDCTIN